MHSDFPASFYAQVSADDARKSAEQARRSLAATDSMLLDLGKEVTKLRVEMAEVRKWANAMEARLKELEGSSTGD